MDQGLVTLKHASVYMDCSGMRLKTNIQLITQWNFINMPKKIYRQELACTLSRDHRLLEKN